MKLDLVGDVYNHFYVREGRTFCYLGANLYLSRGWTASWISAMNSEYNTSRLGFDPGAQDRKFWREVFWKSVLDIDYPKALDLE